MVHKTDLWLVIPNPNDSFGPPIYEGNPEDAHKYLVVGQYSGVISNMMTGDECDLKVYVFAAETVLGRYALVGKS